MKTTRLTSQEVRRLADEVRAKILAQEDRVAQSEGEITIRVYRKGQGFDVKLTITT